MNKRANEIYYDSINKICYVAAADGLFTIKNNVQVPFQYENEFRNITVTDIKKSADNIIWVSTNDKGIYAFTASGIENISFENGLSNNLCRHIFIDKNNVIWVSTYNGLTKLVYTGWPGQLEYSIKKYNTTNGLISNDVNETFVFNDTVWAATSEGLSMFHAVERNAEKIKQAVLITSFSASGKVIDEDERYKLNHNENFIKISFVCLSYKNRDNITYKYRLKNIDEKWSYTTNTSVDFAELKPGKYIFEVGADNPDHTLKAETIELQFTILPAFWQTWWFYILCIFSLLFIVFILIYYRIRRLKKEFNTREQLLSMERTLLELEQKALLLQMNPHFIFNAMNSIQHYIVKNKSDEAYEYLEKFSSLIRKILENSKNKLITLEEEMETLQLYLQIESLRFNDSFHFNIETESGIDTSALLPPMLIQPFIENALWHGLMPKEGEKKVTILFSHRNEILCCEIIDNGIGRKKAKEYSRKKSGTSLGIKLSEERIKYFNEKDNVLYKITVEDLFDKNNVPSGTHVTLLIPENK